MTEILKPSRRGFITGAVSLLVAPAIVRVENLMPVKAIAQTPEEILKAVVEHYYEFNPTPVHILYGKAFIKTEWINGQFLISPIPLDEVDEKN